MVLAWKREETWRLSVKVGDLVKIEYRSDTLFLVLERDLKRWDADRYDDSSKFACWIIQDVNNGKIHIQASRELEVISESR
jgi:hypothetical protein